MDNIPSDVSAFYNNEKGIFWRTRRRSGILLRLCGSDCGIVFVWNLGTAAGSGEVGRN